MIERQTGMRYVLVLALTMALLAACGADPDDSGTDAGVSSGVGPGITVAEALESTVPGPLLINGFIVADSEKTVLAELLAESMPPQAGGATLIVEGLDLSTIPELKSAQGISWTDHQVQLLGEVSDGVLTVSSLSSG